MMEIKSKYGVYSGWHGSINTGENIVAMLEEKQASTTNPELLTDNQPFKLIYVKINIKIYNIDRDFPPVYEDDVILYAEINGEKIPMIFDNQRYSCELEIPPNLMDIESIKFMWSDNVDCSLGLTIQYIY